MAQIPVVKLQNPQLDIVPREFQVELGPAQNTYQRFNALSGGGNQVTFNFTTPNTSTGFSRRVWVRYTVKIDCSSGAGGGIPYSEFSNADSGFRAYPLTSTMDSVALKLNNYTFTINLDDVVHALSVYGNDNTEREHLQGYSPSAPDQFWTYDTAAPYNEFTTAARGPFSNYGDKEDQTSRDFQTWIKDVQFVSFVPVAGVAPPGNELVSSVIVELWEPLLIAPLNSGRRDVTALFGIQTVDLVIVHSNLNRMLAGKFNFPANMQVKIVDPSLPLPSIYVQFLSPQQTQEIPSVLVYPTWQINRFITAQNNQHPRNFKPYVRTSPEPVPVKYTINAITFNSIPDRLFIFAQQPKSIKMSGLPAQVLQEPDCWGRIESIQINFDNQTGILSSADEKDLHWISCSNGSQQTWSEWHWFRGSVLCLQMGKDIPLPLLAAPGSRGVWQFSCELTVRNLRPGYNTTLSAADPTEFNIYTIPLHNGVLTINDSICTTDVGFLTMTDLANAEMAAPGTVAEYQAMVGGSFKSFLGSLWSGIKRAAPVVRDVVGAVSKGAQALAPALASSGDPRAQAVGKALAVGAPVVASVTDALKPRGKGRSGGMLSGGKLVSGRTLSSRARR